MEILKFAEEAALVITGLITIATPLIMKALKARKKIKHEISSFHSKGLSFGLFLQDWNDLEKDLDDLMITTNIDRFLVLKSWNGDKGDRWTTAIFQRRLQNQKPVQYVHVELDDDYISRLKEIENGRDVTFTTNGIHDCLIKRIYEAEGVTASSWYFLGAERIDYKHSVVTYCSFSTLSEENVLQEIDINTLTRCRLIADRLAGLVDSFEDGV